MLNVRGAAELGEHVMDRPARQVRTVPDVPLQILPRTGSGPQRMLMAPSVGPMRPAVHFQAADRSDTGDIDMNALGVGLRVPFQLEPCLDSFAVDDGNAFRQHQRGQLARPLEDDIDLDTALHASRSGRDGIRWTVQGL